MSYLINNFEFVKMSSINDQFSDACKNGDISMVKNLISLGASNFNDGLNQATKREYLNIIKLMILYGADEFDLRHACYLGNLEIINLFITNGCINYNEGLDGACASGNIHIVKYMISLGADDFNWSFITAYNFGHYRIAKLLISHGANCTKNSLEVLNGYSKENLNIPNFCDTETQSEIRFIKKKRKIYEKVRTSTRVLLKNK